MEKTKIILDTDMGSDCDDAGALAVLHRLADEGKAEILAVTHCASEISGPYAVKYINEYYKRKDIPIGRYDTKVFLESANCVRYTKPLMEKYLETHKEQRFENAVRVLRKTLAENENVTISVIGMLNNIAELLKSEPDDISNLNGVELVKKSVKDMFVMGGNFADLSYAEFNIKCDVESAKYVSNNFPCPIIYCGFEIGESVITGNSLSALEANHPVRRSYQIWTNKKVDEKEFLRNSWDPITVYCAVVRDDVLCEKSSKCKISFDDKGRVVLSEGDKDCFLIAKADNEKIRETIDCYLK